MKFKQQSLVMFLCLCQLLFISVSLFSCKSNEKKVEVVDGYMNHDKINENVEDVKTYDDIINESEKNRLKEINFGKYFETDSKNMTDIKWQILYVDNNKKEALITTKYALDYMSFHDKNEICTWETSNIRKFLNQDFYELCFSKDEKEKIIKTNIDNTTIKNMRIDGGNSTSDFIFLASVDEVEKYSITSPMFAKYVLEKKKIQNDENNRDFWLRNNATIKNNKIIYSDDKKYNYSGSIEEKQNLVIGIDYDGVNAYSEMKIVRPLMWIKYDTEKSDNLLNEKEPNEKLKIGKTANNLFVGQYQGEAIDWVIVKREGNKALLLSRYIIDALPYNESGNDCTWETSSLRKYLNDYFYNVAFTEKEKSFISKTINTNDDNENYAINGGNDTIDSIFILSYYDIFKYLHPYDFDNQDEFKKFQFAFETDYVKNKKETTKNNTNRWWVRVPGTDRLHAVTTAMKNDLMDFDASGDIINDKNIGIRPAMWVYFDDDISDIEIAKSITDSMDENSISDYRVAINDNTTKLTLGKYYYDDSNEMKPITWYVVSKDEINNTVFLISESVIETGGFSDNISSNWKNSKIRKWLNKDFYNEVFSEEEKKSIIKYKDDNVFLFSKNDLYFYFKDIASRSAKATQYAKNRKIKIENRYLNEGDKKSMKGGFYWLRNDNPENDNLDIVISTGQFSNTKEYDIDATCENIGIRPVIVVKYKLGDAKLASTARAGKNIEVFSDLFNKNIIIDTIPITDNFKEKVDGDVFKTFGLYKDELHGYKVSVHKSNQEVWVSEFKNDENNNYKHPIYKGMGLLLREIHFAYKLDENNKINDIIYLYTNNYYSEDFKLVKNGIPFTKDNYIEIIEDLCKGQYYKDKKKSNQDEEKYKIFYHDFNQYALSDKYRKSHNLDDSILDKSRFIELADKIGTGNEMIGKKYYVSPMEICPEKEGHEYFDDKMLPVAFNFDTERIYYNIYFTYTDDYKLDTIKIEEAKKKQIKGGDYYDEEW